MTFKQLAQKIQINEPRHSQRLIGIDGGGGAGKSTFASYLQKEIKGSHIVRIDDFYRPPQLRSPVLPGQVINPNFDWNRLRALVFQGVKDGREIQYQLYDSAGGTLSGETVTVPRDATVIIEGVWSLQKDLIDFYDYRIWLEAPAETRLKRGLLRDGEAMREVWEEEFIPIDDRYREILRPQLDADCIVDSNKSDLLNDSIKFLKLPE